MFPNQPKNKLNKSPSMNLITDIIKDGISFEQEKYMSSKVSIISSTQIWKAIKLKNKFLLFSIPVMEVPINFGDLKKQIRIKISLESTLAMINKLNLAIMMENFNYQKEKNTHGKFKDIFQTDKSFKNKSNHINVRSNLNAQSIISIPSSLCLHLFWMLLSPFQCNIFFYAILIFLFEP